MGKSSSQVTQVGSVWLVQFSLAQACGNKVSLVRTSSTFKFDLLSLLGWPPGSLRGHPGDLSMAEMAFNVVHFLS